MTQTISTDQLLLNIKKIDSKLYKAMFPLLTGAEEYNQDDFMYFLMANGFNKDIKGGLIEFINKCFTFTAGTKLPAAKTSKPNKELKKVSSIASRKYDCVNVNIDGEEYDVLEVNATNCTIKNTIVRKKLVVDCVNLTGNVSIYPGCIIQIDCVHDNLKISQL